MSSEKTDVVDLVLVKSELPAPVQKRGISETQWRTLCNALYPGANPASVLMVWDYCAARKLDPMKKPVHIVPMNVRDAKTREYGWRDVVLPGIYEYRTTAHRTGEYLGHSEPSYGPIIEAFGVKAPEWCAMTMYRWNSKASQKVPFPVEVSFMEAVATKKDRKTDEISVNERWTRAPKQMLTKCTEAAGLREAFPEEIGGEPTAEEMEGRHVGDIDVTPIPVEPASASVRLLEQLPEALQENIEKAFAVLHVSPAQRLVKLNEWLGAEGVVPEEAAERLLEWCRDEFAKRKTGQPRVKSDNNTKPNRAVEPAAVDRANHRGGAGGDTGAPDAGAEGDRVARGEHEAPLTVADVPFATQQGSELF